MAKAKVLKFDAAGPGLSKSEILKVCEAENVRFMRLQFTDIFGVIKNVELPSSQFGKALDGEIQFDGSSIEGFTRIEESDMNLVPDLNSFAIYPWAHNAAESRPADLRRLQAGRHAVRRLPAHDAEEADGQGAKPWATRW